MKIMASLKVRLFVPVLASVVGLVGAVTSMSAKMPFVNAFGQYATEVNSHCSIGVLTTDVEFCRWNSGTQCHVFIDNMGSLYAFNSEAIGGAACASPKFRNP